jgi:hypothetical protein
VLIGELAEALHSICGVRPVDRDFDAKQKQQYELRVKRLDKEFDERLRQLYENAIERGLWKDCLARSSYAQHWVEGVQSWFDCNREADTVVAENHYINTREGIQA